MTHIAVCVSYSIYADYYLEIKKPISMMKIRKKLKVCIVSWWFWTYIFIH